ncbi:MAG: class I SAM-dependent methyltransferase [Gemmatimonadetes bacterium]|nr:class I SAM-dependent methyltransferase [Gemmatimonadota bacterium]
MTIQNSSITDGWTRSPGYARTLQSEDQINEVLRLLDLSAARSLADVGCGNGAFAVRAATEYPQCKVFACDSLDAAITECRNRAHEASAGNLTAEVASADRLPLGDDVVDRVLSRNVLHHLSDAHEAYTETARILAPGGVFILEAPYNSGSGRVGEALTRIFQLADDSHVRYYHSLEAIEADLSTYGFRVEEHSAWTFENRTPSGGVEVAEETGASQHLRVQTNEDGVITYQLPVMRLRLRLVSQP